MKEASKKKTRNKRKIALTWLMILAVFFMMRSSAAFAAGTEMCDVTYSLSHITALSGATTVEQGSSLSVTLKASSGYTLPKSIKIYVNGVQMSDGYTYSASTGKISVSEVYGNLKISATGVGKATATKKPSGSSNSGSSCSISYDLSHVKASKNSGNIQSGSSYSVTLKTDSGYSLSKSNITIYLEGDVMTSGYSYSGGVLKINNVKGDTVISAIAVKKSSSSPSSTKKPASASKPSKTTPKKTTPSSSNGQKTTYSHSKSSSSNSSARNKGNSSYQTVTSGNKNVKYIPPKTGDDKVNKWYFIGFGFVLVGAAVLFMTRKRKVH